jgi:plasmid stabilization system protein ParE
MPSIIWSQPALRDVARLHDFLADKSPEAARRAAKTIRQATRLLATHPEVGRPVDELPLGFREWLIGFGQSAYIVLYHFDGREVVILAVRHGREVGY